MHGAPASPARGCPVHPRNAAGLAGQPGNRRAFAPAMVRRQTFGAAVISGHATGPDQVVGACGAFTYQPLLADVSYAMERTFDMSTGAVSAACSVVTIARRNSPPCSLTSAEVSAAA